MKVSFLHHNDNSRRLILIFTGWSTGPSLFEGIDIPGWDLAVAYDYREADFDCSVIDGYYTVYLFAWSMGVAAADSILPADRITAAFAVNGTVTPVSDRFGIPESIFKGTADNLDTRNLRKFRRRMMPDSDSFNNLFNSASPDDDIESLRDELNIFADRYSHKGDEPLLPRLQWTRAYIGANDLIFPPSNMLMAWKADPDVHIVESDDAHYMDIGTVIAGNISDLTKVSKRFTKASATYDSHALSQQMIALHLSDLVRDNIPSNVTDLIEIGPGTGYLTRKYSEYIHPQHSSFVDITETGPFQISGSSTYYVEDAEQWIANCMTNADLIISASAIQWFADIPGFISNCGKVLRQNGIPAISTFSTGNLEELDSLRPSPLRYPSKNLIRKSLEPYFDIITIEEAEMKMEFESYRQLLMHLKHTGVGGSASNAKSSNSHTAPSFNTLTYRPLYFIARRK